MYGVGVEHLDYRKFAGTIFNKDDGKTLRKTFCYTFQAERYAKKVLWRWLRLKGDFIKPDINNIRFQYCEICGKGPIVLVETDVDLKTKCLNCGSEDNISLEG